MVIVLDTFQKQSCMGCDNSKKFQYRTLPLPSVSPVSSKGGAKLYFSLTYLLAPAHRIRVQLPSVTRGAGETRPDKLVQEGKLGRQNWQAGG